MNRRVFWLAVGILAVLYFGFFPVAIDPVVWHPPQAPALEGDYQTNNHLAAADYLFAGNCYKCEDVDRDADGRIYGASETGVIMRFEGERGDAWADTGGRPLGMHFDTMGYLYVADADKGLLRVDPAGQIETLSTHYRGLPYRFADDLDIAPDGKVYFSDASWKYDIWHYKYDLLEHRPNGRLLVYDPTTNQTDLILDSLYFANGVAIDSSGAFLLVNETSKFRVLKHWLKGPKAGRTEILIDNLPGFPDGVSRGTDGIFWVALISPRNPKLDAIMPRPFLRKLLLRLPEFLRPKPQNYSFILGVDATGKVRYNLQDPDGKFAQISSVQERDGFLYLGSLGENGIGRVARPGR
jgi:sugar lactone lactonase YvrE